MSAALENSVHIDRRVAPRRLPTLGTLFHLNPFEDGDPTIGLVWNISTSGISMLLSEPREAGTIFEGRFRTMTGEAELQVVLRVVHVRKIETGDYLLGAQFVRLLSPDEMTPFLA